MNITHLIGRVGRDPEIHTFDGGGKKASFSLATTTKWKDKNGERNERTEWHNIVAFGPVVGVIESYVHKGDQLSITGEIRYREYQVDGNGRKITEIYLNDLELLGSKHEHKPGEDTKVATKEQSIAPDPILHPDDDLPF